MRAGGEAYSPSPLLVCHEPTQLMRVFQSKFKKTGQIRLLATFSSLSQKKNKTKKKSHPLQVSDASPPQCLFKESHRKNDKVLVSINLPSIPSSEGK
jgi:hypothetical protein